MKYRIALALLAAVPLSAASAQDWSKAKRVDIDLANFQYTPSRIVLRHGQPYVLRFLNRASGGHDFTAKSFFATAQLKALDRAKVPGGKVQLAGGQSADVRLVAPSAAAIFEVHCSHFMHDTFGMKGVIAVQ